MSAIVGTLALGGGLVAAVLAVSGWTTLARGRPSSLARPATYALLVAALVACAALEWALVTHDFSVRYVAENGGRGVPLYYTVTSLWGALEGSLLLWLLTLSSFTVLALHRVPRTAVALHPVAMAVLAGVAAFFFALALGGGNPFETVRPAPSQGPGPNPLLQDHPAMGVHPPLLYAGYVGLTVPFAYSVAALVTGRTGRGWVLAVRGWTIAAWCFLTAGIAMGAWWSYAVLGWGGYWAWDPVENASLLPWLTSTALLHSMLVQTRRQALQVWNVSLAGVSFLLVLVGTFLTRSGVVDSVHAFTRSALGPMLLAFLLAVLAGWLALVIWRADRLGPPQDDASPPALVSRQTAVVANNLLLAAIAFTVLLGTIFPLVHQALTGSRVSVGAPYFNRMLAPAALALLALMALGPLVRWDRDDPRELARRAAVPGAIAAGSVGVLGLAGAGGVMLLLVCGLAVFVLATLVRDLAVHLRPGVRHRGEALATLRSHRRPLGALLTHSGVVLAALAVTVSSTGAATTERTVRIGESVSVGEVSARLVGLHRAADGQRMSAAARLDVVDGTDRLGALDPTLSFFPAWSMTVATPAVSSSPLRDVYLTLLAVDDGAGTATVRLAVNPFIGILWASGGVMVAGALLAGWPRRRGVRDAAPELARQARRVREVSP